MKVDRDGHYLRAVNDGARTVYEVKCDKKKEYGTMKSSIVKISPLQEKVQF